MEKEFVLYEQSLALKELGFDEHCFAVYNNPDFMLIRHLKGWENDEMDNVINSIFSEGGFVTAPTYSQAFRWFREKGYDVKVQKESKGLYFGFYWTGAAWIIVGSGSYEEAELECLKKLIEIVKKK